MSWISRFLTIDQTNLHPYSYCFFQCGNFAVQTFIHGAFYRDDLHSTYYDGGQTMFNLPIYTVSVNSESYGHGINAILVGDDPLNFSDWMFIEPQSDYEVYPGRWDMPYNTTVKIQSMSQIYAGGYNGG